MHSRRPLRRIARIAGAAIRLQGAVQLVLALFVATNRLAAQQDSLGVAAGQRIRATFRISDANRRSTESHDRTRSIKGSLVRQSGDTLVMAEAGRSAGIAILRSDLRRLEVSRGRRTRTGGGAMLGALIGAGAGAVSGLVICQVITSCDASGSDSLIEGELTCAVILILGLGCGLAGTGIGAVVGSLSHTDRWHPIDLGEPGTRRAPGATGIRVGLSVSF